MYYYNLLKLSQCFSLINFLHKKKDLDVDIDPNGDTYGCFQHLYFDEFTTNERIALEKIQNSKNFVTHISLYSTKEPFFLKILQESSDLIKKKINLTIGKVPITAEGYNIIPKYLTKLKISSLCLEYSELELGFEKIFFETLNKCKYLRKLWLTDTEISYEIAKIISNLLLNENISLRTLRIHKDYIFPEMFDMILKSAENSKSLKKLIIQTDQIIPSLHHKIINLLNNGNITSVGLFNYGGATKCRRRKIGYDIEPTFNGLKLIIHHYNLYLKVYILILKHILDNPNLKIVEIVLPPKNDIQIGAIAAEIATFSELFEIICEKNIIIPNFWLNKKQRKRMKAIKKLNKKAMINNTLKNENNHLRSDSICTRNKCKCP